MPGHFGIYGKGFDAEDVRNAVQLMVYLDDIHDLTLDQENSLICGQVKDKREISPATFENEVFRFHVDGEIFEPDLGEIQKVESRDALFSLLPKINGYYSMIIHDRKHQQIHLVTDRYGIRPLYFYQNDSSLGWSTELKSLVKTIGIKLNLNQNAIRAYVDLGFLPGDLTWYDEIELIPAASIWTINLTSRQLQKSRYWSWADMENRSQLNLEEAVKATAQIFHNAVNRRVQNDQDHTVALSGGLDSRAIAWWARKAHPLCFTFGAQDSDDIRLSKQVARTLDLEHRIFTYDKSNWLNDKIGSIWRTEGMMPFFHLHSSPFCRQFASLGDTVFNGYGGATILGGVFLGKTQTHIRKIEPYIDLDFEFYGDHLADALIIDQHMRRFVNQGTIDVGKYLVQRLPYLDVHLMEHVITLPNAYRKNHNLFLNMLKDQLPSPLYSITWENTGLPISPLWLSRSLLSMKWPTIKRVGRLRRPAFNYRRLVDRSFIETVKDHWLHHGAEIWNYIKDPEPSNLFEDLQETGRILSLEIWLRLATGENSPDESFTRF